MNKTTEERHISILDEMTDFIIKEVSSAELIEIDPRWDDELDMMFWLLSFSIGTNTYDITICWDGSICGYDRKMPKHLLVDIHNGICAGYLKGIMNESIRS